MRWIGVVFQIFKDVEAEVDYNFQLVETNSSDGSSYYKNNEDIAQQAYNQDNIENLINPFKVENNNIRTASLRNIF